MPVKAADPIAAAAAPRAEETLRSRLGPTAPSRPVVSTVPDGGEADWLEFAWRLRFVFAAIFVAAVLLITVRNLGGAGSANEVRRVAVGQRISGSDWDYVVSGPDRVASVGDATARGIFVVVPVSVTRHAEGARALSPSDFVLADASGGEYSALPVESGAYQTQSHPEGLYPWPASIRMNQATTLVVVYDVSPAIRGLQLVIADAHARVRLD